MIKANKELMRQARESLDGNWGMAVGTLLVYTLLNRFHTIYTLCWILSRGTHGSWTFNIHFGIIKKTKGSFGTHF